MNNLFNNCNANTNGEKHFYNKIKNNIETIFDVGCRQDTLFIDFKGDVHYFDPVEKFIKNLSLQRNSNKNSYFNSFGLANENSIKKYYPSAQSFFSREKSCPRGNYNNFINLQVKKASDYINKKDIKRIDFLKIDTEGHEFDVLKGFGEKIKDVHIIQFEYGGCNIDSNYKLNDIIEYLQNKNFHKFSYLKYNGYQKIKDMKNKIIKTHLHRNLGATFNYPEYVNFINEDGSIPDHFNYCNVVCINKNSNLSSLLE